MILDGLQVRPPFVVFEMNARRAGRFKLSHRALDIQRFAETGIRIA